jgi:hypothetical protein
MEKRSEGHCSSYSPFIFRIYFSPPPSSLSLRDSLQAGFPSLISLWSFPISLSLSLFLSLCLPLCLSHFALTDIHDRVSLGPVGQSGRQTGRDCLEVSAWELRITQQQQQLQPMDWCVANQVGRAAAAKTFSCSKKGKNQVHRTQLAASSHLCTILVSFLCTILISFFCVISEFYCSPSSRGVC